MGLHLNFELRLPGTAPRPVIVDTLVRLRKYALQAPVAEVTELISIDRPWVQDRSALYELEPFFRHWTSILVRPIPDEPDADMIGEECSAVGFVVAPGKRCEPAPFGFLRRRDATGDREEWFWQTCCKTQYASVVSEEHLVNCHTALVSILDRAIEMGIDVVVRDETGYWESRDTSVLIESVRKMNHIVAAFAGAFRDAMPQEMQSQVRGSIFEHPRFERIEMGECDA